jgi:hypothetical protein
MECTFRPHWVEHYLLHMPTRLLFVATMLAILLATVVVDAKDDCLAGPNVAAPQGSHWYYRVDRATQRECWYLGPEGKEVRAHTHQGGSPAQSYPSNKERGAQPASQTPVQAGMAEAAGVVPPDTVSVEITLGQAKTHGDNPTERATDWSGISTSTASVAPVESPAPGGPASELPISLAQLGTVFGSPLSAG